MNQKNQIINEYQSQPIEVQKDICRLVSSRVNIGTRRLELMLAGQEVMPLTVIQEFRNVIDNYKLAIS